MPLSFLKKSRLPLRSCVGLEFLGGREKSLLQAETKINFSSP